MASPKAFDPILKQVIFQALYRSQNTGLRTWLQYHVFNVHNAVRHTRGYHQTSIMLQIRKLGTPKRDLFQINTDKSVNCWSEPLIVFCYSIPLC